MKEFLLKEFKIILPWIMVAILGFLLFNSYNALEEERKVYNQNQLFFSDSLRKLNDNWFTKYAFVTELNKDKDSLLEKNNETIFNKDQLILQLKNITVEENKVDTVYVKKDEEGNVISADLVFKDSTKFYSYTDSIKYHVNIDSIKQTFNIKFNTFKVNVFLTRNEEGVWSGYGEVDKELQQYIGLSGLKVEVDKDKFLGMQSRDNFSFDIIPLLNIYEANESHLGLGVGGLFNDKYFFSFNKALNQSYYFLQFGYKMPLIKED